MRNWEEIKLDGSEHYKVGKTEPIDLYAGGRLKNDTQLTPQMLFTEECSVNMRPINEKGLAIIKESETCKLTMYICPGGKKTIGWGHVLPDDTDIISIPQSLADGWLREDIEKTEEQLAVATQHIILTDNQWSALVSFVFNIGIGNFIQSTLKRKLNEGDYQGAADEFGRWVYAKGKKLNGLIIRRAKERSLFLEST